MSDALFEVKLTASEAMLLDGKCSPEVQAVVDRARTAAALASDGVAPEIAAFVTSVIDEARKNGRLIHRAVSLTYCSVCKKAAGYYPHTRSGRYHRKGEPDRKRPKYFGGIEFRDSFVRMQGYASCGACAECVAKAMPSIKRLLQDVKAELPPSLTGKPQRWRKFDLRKCKECGWQGNESQMKPSATMMGDGYFFGKCPQCNAENHIFNTSVESVSGHELVDVRQITLDLLLKIQEDAHKENVYCWVDSTHKKTAALYLGSEALQGELQALSFIVRRDGDLTPHRELIDKSVATLRADLAREPAEVTP